jgi:uncharacterized protein (DUF362 family)/NAD-dependent dihydropyrimidine dehydrogenase PreA subunit
MKRKVWIARCESYDEQLVEQVINDWFKQLGPINDWCHAQKVILKPNLLSARDPGKAITTHPAVIKAVAKAFLASGKQVLVVESGVGKLSEETLRLAYRVCGLQALADEINLELNYDISYQVINGHNILTPVADAEFIVNLCKMKTHGLMYYTGAVKNMLGVVPGKHKAALHSVNPTPKQFANYLLNLNQVVSPQLNIMDGIIGMQGDGPANGFPKHSKLLLMSWDCHALDYVATQVMGLNLKKNFTLQEAMSRQLISREGNEVEVEGLSIEEARTKFVEPNTTRFITKFMPQPLADWLVPYPIIKANCIACGKCVEVCPQNTISLPKQALINHANCIKCYCCHECCPADAIGFTRKK